MEDSRQSTVLFADVSGSTQLYQVAGDTTAHGAISGCVELMRKAVEAARGRVVKTIGDEVMALFPSADAAVAAAATMLGAVEALPAVGGSKLGLRVGLQAGAVIQHGEDVFGDTVNLASRLVEQANKGQIITTEETAQLLNPVYRMFTRKLYSIQVKGKAEGIALCEVLWFASGERTAFDGFRPRVRTSGVLRLKYLGQETVRRRENESVTLGRQPAREARLAAAGGAEERAGEGRVGVGVAARAHGLDERHLQARIEQPEESVLQRDQHPARVGEEVRGRVAAGAALDRLSRRP